MQATAEVIDGVIQIVVAAQQPLATQNQRRQAVEVSDQVWSSGRHLLADQLADRTKDMNEALLDRRFV